MTKSETPKILVLPGDGIGPEIVNEGVKVLDFLREHGLSVEVEYGLIGGAAYDKTHSPFPADTIAQADNCDAILLGAVGGPQYDEVERHLRPEQGLLDIRAHLNLFANLRPALLYAQLASASSLKPELVADLDLLIVRELTGGIYFGQPRAREVVNNVRRAYNTMVYDENEIRRIAHVAFLAAQKRDKRLCSVDKANVLEVSLLWREVMEEVHRQYSDVELSHMYVDNAAMQLVRAPKQFDVMVTSNLFGDILSDAAAMLTGSIGMLPSASLNQENKGMYEPIHGSAPDIAGKGIANPLATILSLAMLLRYSFNQVNAAKSIEQAVIATLQQGVRTQDIVDGNIQAVSTIEMGDAVLANLQKIYLHKV
ncbi:MAG: 3-isopropylmalate dehydrogenase [Gammaproteobacteria bacterium]|nr:3-isopropylmalate dehydrogenase [Gammaproteobacteria bacterium]